MDGIFSIISFISVILASSFFGLAGNGYAKGSFRLHTTNLQIMGRVDQGFYTYVLAVRPDQQVRLYRFSTQEVRGIEIGRLHSVDWKPGPQLILQPFPHESVVTNLESPAGK